MNEIMFHVEEDPEGGYTARALGHAICTEAETEEGIHAAVRDALRCHFDSEAEMPKIVRLHFAKDRVIANAWNSEGALGSRPVPASRGSRIRRRAPGG
jgi:hypothetical protein